MLCAAVLCGILDVCIVIQLMIITAEEPPDEAKTQIELLVLLFPEWSISLELFLTIFGRPSDISRGVLFRFGPCELFQNWLK